MCIKIAILRQWVHTTHMGRRAESWTVIDRGTGYWYYKIAGAGYRSTGIRITRSRGGAPTNRREAERYAQEQFDRALYEREDGPTLRVYLEPYYTDQCPRCTRLATDGRPVTDRHRSQQRKRLEHHVFPDPVSTIPVRNIRPRDIEDWKARQVAMGTGARTINATLTALSAAFSEGLYRDEVSSNPVAPVSAVRQLTQEGFGVFTPAELAKMFVKEPESWGYDGGSGKRAGADWRPAVAFGLIIATVGERPSAILRVNWGHYDGETIAFPRVKDRRKNHRVVPLTSHTIAALDAWKSDHKRTAPADPIFGYDAGGRMGQTWFAGRFARMMERLELPKYDAYGGKRVPYSLKYTLETELIDRGANPSLVRDLMGHSHQRGAPETILTPVQARYRRQRADKIRELLPVIESIISDS